MVYIDRVHCIHMLHLFYNTLVHVIYSGVSGQCSHTIMCLNIDLYKKTTIIFFFKFTIIFVAGTLPDWQTQQKTQRYS